MLNRRAISVAPKPSLLRRLISAGSISRLRPLYLSRNTAVTQIADSTTRTVGYAYDLAGRRTQVTWPDSFDVMYDYDLTDVVAIREEGATSGPSVLAEYAYDNLVNAHLELSQK